MTWEFSVFKTSYKTHYVIKQVIVLNAQSLKRIETWEIWFSKIYIFNSVFLEEKYSCRNMHSIFAFSSIFFFFTSLMFLQVNKLIFLKFPLNSFTIHPNQAGRQLKNKSIQYQLQQRIFIYRQYFIGLQNPNEIWINNLQKASP